MERNQEATGDESKNADLDDRNVQPSVALSSSGGSQSESNEAVRSRMSNRRHDWDDSVVPPRPTPLSGESPAQMPRGADDVHILSIATESTRGIVQNVRGQQPSNVPSASTNDDGSVERAASATKVEDFTLRRISRQQQDEPKKQKPSHPLKLAAPVDEHHGPEDVVKQTKQLIPVIHSVKGADQDNTLNEVSAENFGQDQRQVQGTRMSQGAFTTGGSETLQAAIGTHAHEISHQARSNRLGYRPSNDSTNERATEGASAASSADERSRRLMTLTQDNEQGNVQDDLLSAQLVDPEAEQQKLHRNVQQLVDERLSRLVVPVQGTAAIAVHEPIRPGAASANNEACCVCCTVCGIDFSKRSNQVVGVLVVVVVVLGSSLAAFAIGSQASSVTSSANDPFSSDSSTMPSFYPTQQPTPQPLPVPTVPPPTQSVRITLGIGGNPWEDAEWTQIGSSINGEASGDQSGISVSLSRDGSVLAVGATHNDRCGVDSGHVRVYRLKGGEWLPRGDALCGETSGDWFGSSVSLSEDGTVLAVGANEHDSDNGVDSGQVQVFVWNGSTWAAMGSSHDGEDAFDNFGVAVALSSDGIVVAGGAWLNDGGGTDSGHVRVFAWNGTEWFQRGLDLDGQSFGDWFGFSVSLSFDGSVVASGAYWNDDNGTAAGQVRVFRWTGEVWNLIGSTINGQNAHDYFGVSVSLSGDGAVVAVGAEGGNYCSVFGLDTDSDNNNNNKTQWVQLGDNVRGEAVGDRFGRSVALSLGGDTLVVGATQNNANGLNNSGRARVFRLLPSRHWVQVGKVLNGDPTDDSFGRSVTMSGDGSRIAIGAYLNNENGIDAGQVRVYQLA